MLGLLKASKAFQGGVSSNTLASRLPNPKWGPRYSGDFFGSCSSSSTRWVRTLVLFSFLSVHSGQALYNKKWGRVFMSGLVIFNHCLLYPV